jgi:hypothetical protein
MPIRAAAFPTVIKRVGASIRVRPSTILGRTPFPFSDARARDQERRTRIDSEESPLYLEDTYPDESKSEAGLLTARGVDWEAGLLDREGGMVRAPRGGDDGGS